MGVKNKPFPWFSSISSTRIDESTKALCFLCGCNQGKISRLPYNHILALKPCLLENFRATTSCTASPFLPLPTQTTLSNIPVIPLTAPFFCVGFSFSHPHLNFCFSWDIVLCLHCSLTLVDHTNSHQPPYICEWLTHLYPHSRPFLFCPVYLTDYWTAPPGDPTGTHLYLPE